MTDDKKISVIEKREMIFDHNLWIAEQIIEAAEKIDSGHYCHDIKSVCHRLKESMKGANRERYVDIGMDTVFTEILRLKSILAASLYMQEKGIWK